MRYKRVSINGQFNRFVGTPSTANQPFRRNTIKGQFNRFLGAPSKANSTV
jgi:hypothetical protein